jgi:hypothetical protein
MTPSNYTYTQRMYLIGSKVASMWALLDTWKTYQVKWGPLTKGVPILSYIIEITSYASLLG